MEQLQRDVQSLTDKMKSLHISAQPKRKRRGAGISKTQVASQPAIAGGKPLGTSRKRKGKANSPANSLTLTRRELLISLNVTNDGLGVSAFVPIIPANMNFLKKFSMFDRVRWNKLEFFYKPCVGSTTDGSVSYGVKWAFDAQAKKNRGDISQLTPNASHAIWFDGEARPMRCPLQKLRTRMWYDPGDTSDNVEQGPGVFYVSADAPDKKKGFLIGEIWVDYSVTLMGTTF